MNAEEILKKHYDGKKRKLPFRIINAMEEYASLRVAESKQEWVRLVDVAEAELNKEVFAYSESSKEYLYGWVSIADGLDVGICESEDTLLEEVSHIMFPTPPTNP